MALSNHWKKNMNYRNNNLLMALSILSVSLLSGCSAMQTGAAHRPIIDGPINAKYESDLAQCQTAAENRSYFNSEVQQDALIGTAVGALVGAGGDTGSIVGGAAAGAVIGGGSSALDTRTERKNIVINCMRSRGYKVLESLGEHN